MDSKEFFNEIEHSEVPWMQYQLHAPLFYQDIRFMSVSILAPMERILDILPSNRLKPYRSTPWKAALSRTAHQYRESDLGPCNEVSMSITITLDEEPSLFTGSLRKTPKVPSAGIGNLAQKNIPFKACIMIDVHGSEFTV